jgi:hypothetical protein
MRRPALYKGKRERPLRWTERWQLALSIAVMVVAVVATLLGLRAFGPVGRTPLSSVLGHGAILVVIAIGYFSMRHLRSIRQRRFHAALVAMLALLWLVEVVGYLIDR